VVQRVAEDAIRLRRFGPKLRVRVDLHGVSTFGPGDQHSLIRWEWIEDIAVDRGVRVRSANAEIELPPRAFGLPPGELAQRLRDACSIERRPRIIGELNVLSGR
jgi:hypothetical protein